MKNKKIILIVICLTFFIAGIIILKNKTNTNINTISNNNTVLRENAITSTLPNNTQVVEDWDED